MSLYGRFRLLTLSILQISAFLCLRSESMAQGLGNSPYSSVGLGEFYGEAFSDNTGMGGSGVSTASGFQINNLNPALWVRNRFTTLDVGLIGQYKNVVSGSRTQGNAGGNLAYVSLSFPVHPRWAIGINIKPYAFVDYGDSSSRQVPGTPYLASYYTTGKGGMNKASITNSVQVTKFLSLGLETSYYFGNVRKATEVSLPVTGTGDYIVSLNDRTTYSDISFRAGAAARIPLKKNKLNLNLGGSYSFGASIRSNQTTTFEVKMNSFDVQAPDTLSNNLGGSVKIPEQYQVGASLEWPLKLILSADYNRQSWSQYRGFGNVNSNLVDVNRFNVGAEFLPKFTSLNYFDIVRYRIGFSYGNTPYMINAREVKDASVSVGVTFPMGRGYQNLLSLAIVGGQRGQTGGGLVRERYGKVVLGVTLLERWFQKQKLD